MKHLVFQSFDEYASTIQHADVRMTLTKKDQRNWGLDYLPVGDISIQWGGGGAANACEGSSDRGGLTVFVPMHPSEASRSDKQNLLGNGERLHNGSVMILEPGSEFCIAATEAHRWSSIFVPYELLTAIHAPVMMTGQSHHVLSPSTYGRDLQSRVESLAAILRDAPDSLCSTSAIAAAKTKITEAVAAAISCNGNATMHSGRPSLPRAFIVRTALNMIEEHSEEHLSVWKLSGLVGVSERTLRTAFDEYFGVGPTRYLKIRILREARKLLRTSDPFSKSVTDVAVGLGIWEFGRFSRDYKVLFGELPSETLRKNN
jgi:AraC family transcriptional regulator, ethanolamine operon transcriptional activator